jgi:single-stranded DNA-specific DHH superfamily exonuclease
VAEILRARGVENIEAYMRPSQEYENDSMLLDNIEIAAKRLVEHLERKSSILFIVD